MGFRWHQLHLDGYSLPGSLLWDGELSEEQRSHELSLSQSQGPSLPTSVSLPAKWVFNIPGLIELLGGSNNNSWCFNSLITCWSFYMRLLKHQLLLFNLPNSVSPEILNTHFAGKDTLSPRTHLIFTTLLAMIISIFQRRKLRIGELKQCVQVYKARE